MDKCDEDLQLALALSLSTKEPKRGPEARRLRLIRAQRAKDATEIRAIDEANAETAQRALQLGITSAEKKSLWSISTGDEPCVYSETSSLADVNSSAVSVSTSMAMTGEDKNAALSASTSSVYQTDILRNVTCKSSDSEPVSRETLYDH
jgi:hypothetical protein